MRPSRLLPLTLLALCVAARGEELRLVGRHSLEGELQGRAFGGWVEVLPDATYRGERRFADGSVEPLAGAAAIDGRELVLTPAQGATGAPAAGRHYRRDDDGRVPRWRFEAAGERELLRQEKQPEPEWWHLLKRVTVEGRPGHWLLHDNLGTVDRNPLILRSRRPSPGDLIRLQEKRGLETVLSLNGDQDEEARLWRDGKPLHAEKVNLRDFIARRGLEHVVVHMSASRAPTDAELVAVFRVLLDETKAPLLMHCQGGSDRTGIIAALYAVEFQGQSKAQAKRTMRRHLWAATNGTEIQGAYLDLYQKGTLRRLLQAAGVPIPARFQQVP